MGPAILKKKQNGHIHHIDARYRDPIIWYPLKLSRANSISCATERAMLIFESIQDIIP